MPEPIPWPQVRSGDTVTYHGLEDDQSAEIIRFDGVGNARLQLADGTELFSVREGDDGDQWSAIPPRRRVRE